MDERKKLIEQLQDRIEENRLEVDAQVKKLGICLSFLDAGSFLSSPLEAEHEKARDLREQLPLHQQKVHRIVQLAARHGELREKIKELDSKVREADREAEGFCEEIARLAFAAFKSTPDPSPFLQDLFAELSRMEGELREIDLTIERSQASLQKGGLIVRIKEHSRVLYLRSLKGMKVRALQRCFSETGQRIGDAEAELARELHDKDLANVLKPYRKNRDIHQTLQASLSDLDQEQNAIGDELRALEAERGPEKRIRELERQIRKIESDLDQTLRRIGEGFRAKPLKDLAEQDEVRGLLKKIRQCERSIEGDGKHIERLQASLRIDELNTQIAGMQKRIGQYEQEIEKYHKEIGQLRNRIERTEVERERQEKAQGPAHTLFGMEEPAEGAPAAPSPPKARKQVGRSKTP